MDLSRTVTGCVGAVPAKSPSTARPCPPSVRRIRPSLCRRPSAGLLSSCDFISSIICRLKPRISETRAQANFGQSYPRTLCARLYFRACPPSALSMTENKVLLPLVAIVGPTASGKSALGVKLAERLGGGGGACDSTQLYRGFDIGDRKSVGEGKSVDLGGRRII